MMSYTKGEWGITKSNNKDYALYVVADMEVKPKGIALIKNYQPFSDEMEANTQLIVTAVNACIKLNKDNPLAVAESISDLYEALKKISIILANPLTTRTEEPVTIRIHRAADAAWQLSLETLAKVERSK